MKKTSLFLALFLSVMYCYSQPSISWQKSLGGTLDDRANLIRQTTDGGYIIAGFTRSNDGDVTGNHGGADCWIVKLSNAGVIEWQKTLGGTLDETACSIQQTTDGGYIFAGDSLSNDNDVTGNNGNSDIWVVKLSNAGVIEWRKSLGGTDFDVTYSIQQTTDDGYIIAGYSKSNNFDVTGNHGNFDYWVVKLSNAGVIEWQKCLGGTNYEGAFSMQQTIDGGYIIAGHSNSNDGDVTGNHGDFDYWVVKLSNAGAIEWQKSLGGTGADKVTLIQQTTDEGYIIAGYSTSNDGDVTGNHGGSDCWIVKLSDAGIIEWQKSLGGILEERVNSIRQTTDGGYIMAGLSYSNDGDVTGNHGGSDFWIVKLNSALGANESTFKNLFSIYPNPANKELHVNTKENALGLPYTIYDQVGKSVMNGKLNEQNSIIETDNLSKGVYIFSVGDKIKSSAKIIKE